MRLNTNLLSGAVGSLLGIIGGTAVTAYGMGLEKATITQNIERNKAEVDDLKKLISEQLVISNGHLDQINASIHDQALHIGEIKTKVEVLEAIVTRIEQKK